MNIQRITYEKLGKSINCSKLSMEKYPKIFNKNNMSALDNFATKNNLKICFSCLKTNEYLKNNTQMYVSKNKNYNGRHFLLEVIEDTREDFCNSLRTIYKNVEELLKTSK